ncbi:MAG TPA: hypothetical protein VLB44_08880 [Kofleriaceae bacterium]|nr:hypothetical protein [Kofleriaceae bacterium]
MKRDATKTIWRTVVFAGAMLGVPACSKKQPQTTPSNVTKPAATDTTTPASTDSTTPAPPTQSSDPCAGVDRPRGADDDGGGGMGRGFVLS